MKEPVLASHKACTGCMVCADSCNVQHAIHCVLEEDGHYYPMWDRDKCVGCLKCEKACPVVSTFSYQTKDTPHYYAVWNKNDVSREKSASGGAFSAMAEAVLDKGGVVIGAAISGVCDVRHEVVSTKGQLSKLQGSKYTQSRTDGIYAETFALLKAGKLVLFSGTGCQVAGLLSFLSNKKYEGKLITVDLICGGVPSKHLINKFIENEPYEVLKILSFRTKEKGWSPRGFEYNMKTLDSEGATHDYTGKNDLISKGFAREYTNRWSCYDCQFSSTGRLSDFTIGDFWGIKEFEEQFYAGISLLVSHNEEAEAFLEDISSYLDCHPASESDAIRHNYRLYSGKQNRGHALERKLLVWSSKHLSYNTFKKIYAYDNPGLMYKIYNHLSQKILDIVYYKSKNKNK